MSQIIRNALITPDGTLLESKHRHDYKSHTDTITGETYVCDGGLDYFKGSINKVQPAYLHVTTDDPFELQREAFTWGSYGKNGDEPLHHVKLKNMTNEHIYAVLKTQPRIRGTYVEDLFGQELECRNDNHPLNTGPELMKRTLDSIDNILEIGGELNE